MRTSALLLPMLLLEGFQVALTLGADLDSADTLRTMHETGAPSLFTHYPRTLFTHYPRTIRALSTHQTVHLTTIDHSAHYLQCDNSRFAHD